MEMQNNGGIFTSVVKKKQRRSNFNLSHDVKLSLDMGYCIPIHVQECIPGDHTTIKCASMLRMAPLVSPVMHKIDVFKEFFFVPNRILWGNWETFITGSRNGKQLPADELPDFPKVLPFDDTKMANTPSSLMDYLGLPVPSTFDALTPVSTQIAVNAMPFAAYQRIWDEYYRDENLQESMYDVLDGTPNAENYNQLTDGIQTDTSSQQLGALRPRCWEHDYFTSALPWAQKGEAVSIPVDMGMVLRDDGQYHSTNIYSRDPDDLATTPADPIQFLRGVPLASDPNKYSLNAETTGGGAGGSTMVIDNTNSMANSATINDLRAAIKLQEWLETNARGGTRYFESIYAHFGVKSPDSRLQRPEFIGSSRSSMVISEVLQTSSPQGDADTPQGNMSGHGMSVDQTNSFKYYAQEHGYIIGIMSVMPRTAYQQGIPRHWLKTEDRLDYYFPEFAHLGEQNIQTSELYAGGPIGDVNEVFGYTPRYAEYKFMNSRVAGDFRDTLSFWHLGRIFDNIPQLNDLFVTSGDTIGKRIYAVQDLPIDSEDPPAEPIRNYDSIYAHVFHDIKCSRLMPKYGTPRL